MISHLAAAAAALALGAPTATPGVTATTITIGGTIPISGPAAAYASVGKGADAYFRYVNTRGGVFGRKIVYKYLDDQFEVAKTILLTWGVTGEIEGGEKPILIAETLSRRSA